MSVCTPHVPSDQEIDIKDAFSTIAPSVYLGRYGMQSIDADA
jgi:hypothetical protein